MKLLLCALGIVAFAGTASAYDTNYEANLLQQQLDQQQQIDNDLRNINRSINELNDNAFIDRAIESGHQHNQDMQELWDRAINDARKPIGQ